MLLLSNLALNMDVSEDEAIGVSPMSSKSTGMFFIYRGSKSLKIP